MEEFGRQGDSPTTSDSAQVRLASGPFEAFPDGRPDSNWMSAFRTRFAPGPEAAFLAPAPTPVHLWAVAVHVTSAATSASPAPPSTAARNRDHPSLTFDIGQLATSPHRVTTPSIALCEPDHVIQRCRMRGDNKGVGRRGDYEDAAPDHSQARPLVRAMGGAAGCRPGRECVCGEFGLPGQCRAAASPGRGDPARGQGGERVAGGDGQQGGCDRDRRASLPAPGVVLGRGVPSAGVLRRVHRQRHRRLLRAARRGGGALR